MTSADNFSRAASTYRQNAVVQKLMAKNTCALIKNKNFDKILEIGSGTGFLTDNIVENFKFKKLILNDITDNFTSYKNFEFLKGDALKIDLPKDLNLVISNACFQWIEDIESFFLKLKSCLKNDGLLVFSSFGEQNCKQFQIIEHTGLNYPYYPQVLEKCGYKILEYQKEIHTVYFSSPREVLRHIKSTGAIVRGKKWNKEHLKTFEKLYLEKFEDKNGVELTYNPVYFVAKIK